MIARGPDAGTLVERALALSARRAGIELEIVEAVATAWASATFNGARHVLQLQMAECEAAREWLAGLAEADMPMRGQLLADCIVVERRVADGIIDARVEALTVEEV